MKLNEFIEDVNKLEKAVLKLAWKDMYPSRAEIHNPIETIFRNHVDIEKTEITSVLEILDKQRIHYRVKNLILAIWITKLDNLDTQESFAKKQMIVRKYLLKMV